MEKDKNKVATVDKLLVRVGGLVITLPIAVMLGGTLIVLSYIMSTLLFNTPDIPASVLPFLISIIGICLFTLFGLARATLKYTGGIGNLVNRLRGIQQEQARVERLMAPENRQDNLEVLAWLADDSQQQMKR